MMLRYLTLLAALCCTSSAAVASVVINTTRVIYPENARMVNVQLVNKSTSAHLVQTWIDTGNTEEPPEKISTPFSVTPAVVKVRSGEGQALKITARTASSLPRDRESVFWLNVLDVPPVPEGSGESANYLQVALRSRIKLFFRPDNLNISVQDIDSHLSLRQNNGKTCLNNASPYYVTVTLIAQGNDNDVKKQEKNNLLPQAAFVAPFSCYPLSFNTDRNKPYQLIRLDDFGSRKHAGIAHAL